MINLDLISDALRALNVINEVETASAEQASLCLREMNQMLSGWAVDGITLGYFAQSDTSATCPVPDWAEAGVKYQLALKVAHYFGASISIETAAAAVEGMDRILRTVMNLKLEGVDMSHLPMGSGIRGFIDITR